jgi:pyrimidine-nucleoside phosphorylase
VITRWIERKRDGGALSDSEWREILTGFTSGRIPGYQIAALLMAIRFRGLNLDELNSVTDCMLESGGSLVFADGPAVVDKHSTGGVGDKVSLVLAPLVASCGLRVPMMSGRGLGHTGGTLDKLESIPGFRTDLSLLDAQRQIDQIGCALIGQTEEIAPADKKLYALRDVTGTVEIPPLIAASIMSKKLAEGLDGLVLDVKRGNGAFMPELQDGLDLAQTMVGLGEARGCATVAVITAMDQPLGRACGNALETEEAILALKGEGPEDLMNVTMSLGAEMLLMGGVVDSASAAEEVLKNALGSGRAAERFQQIIQAQGGNPAIVDDPAALPQADHHAVVNAECDGIVTAMDTRAIGWGVVEMGGGRSRVEDAIDPAVGFLITKVLGDTVQAGEPIASVYGSSESDLEIGRRVLDNAITVGEGNAERVPLISHRISSAGISEIS